MFCNGKFELIKKLGRGSFGEVYLVNDKDSDQKKTDSLTALKSYRFSFNDYSAFTNAKNEEFNLRMLKNKYICTYLNFHQELDSFFITLEYCEGGDLTQTISFYKEEKILIAQTKLLQMLLEISKGLKYLHENKIIHRDIKPSNIFLKNNQIKLGDFGLSIYLSSVSQAFSTNVGTPHYISPELIEDNGYDFKTDIWSAGCVFYELITLNKLFAGETFKDIIESIKNLNLPDLSSIYLKEVLTKMLIKNIKVRISSSQLVKTLKNLIKLKKINDFETRKANSCNKLIFKHRKYILFEKKKNATGFGTVFIVDDPEDYERKVIKVVKNNGNLNEYERISKEILDLKSIDCSNLVNVIDFFVELNSLFTVQSYCNQSLETFISKNRQTGTFLSEKKVIHISTQLIRAISTLHSKNLVHKNIKPTNIFLHNECLKIGDYCLESNTEEIFNVSRKSGVLNFISPEYIQNERITSKVDIWSCGCVIYELMLNEKAFDEITTMSLLDSIINGEPKKIELVFQSIQFHLKQMLNKDPNKRPESIELLKKFLVIT